MKLIKRLVAIILVVTGLYWGACLVKCEILTKRHGDEFSQLYQDNTMLGPQAYWKVLEYSDTHAAVYFVSEGGLGGDLLKFTRNGEKWQFVSWDTIWSKTGSADGFIWPYIR